MLGLASSLIFLDWLLKVCCVEFLTAITSYETSAQGLSLAAVEHQDAEQLFSPALFNEGEDGKIADVHAFTILARILADTNAASTKPHGLFGFYNESLAKHGESIRRYVDQWIGGGSDVDKKVDELIWTTALIYGVGGAQKAEFNADFFL